VGIWGSNISWGGWASVASQLFWVHLPSMEIEKMGVCCLESILVW